MHAAARLKCFDVQLKGAQAAVCESCKAGRPQGMWSSSAVWWRGWHKQSYCCVHFPAGTDCELLGAIALA